ncbi:hypothetical protein Taro_004218 [Colocasia esculenta]|uniref:Nuclear speckle splicing regulatory protein 1 N-terminal domain-containing protein n=1 Tax=Colocasia esculenta TaxID=4460 RepID=A0A843TPF9_COLES|nr:hypothetical protein [Colocasia esculenta]
MSGYGLQLRKKPAAARPSLPPPAPGFGDAEEDDVEREIARQAAVNRAKKEVEAAHKKALEEDASIFDYDGAYDKFKVETARPLLQDRAERKSKYIEKLLDKAKEREREHEIIYEKKLLKERSKEDHLFAGKEKFVTSAYKKKLAEQAKWLEEERLRELREERDDVTKKSDLSDFYFNLNKNVAFGSRGAESSKGSRPETATDGSAERQDVQETQEQASPGRAPAPAPKNEADAPFRPPPCVPRPPEPAVPEQTSVPEKAADVEQASQEQQTGEHYKRSEDAVAAARARYLARKRAREQ